VQPSAAVPIATTSKARLNLAHESHLARARYADSSAVVAEFRECREDVNRGEELIIKAEASGDGCLRVLEGDREWTVRLSEDARGIAGLSMF
jgi:hypothetical protein